MVLAFLPIWPRPRALVPRCGTSEVLGQPAATLGPRSRLAEPVPVVHDMADETASTFLLGPPAARPGVVMERTTFGLTGLSVARLGFGANRLGEAGVPRDGWVGLVREAADLGVNFFDTSESYGWGASEEILGEALAGRTGMVIATKISRPRGAKESDFTADRVVAQCEASLRRLRRDCIEVYQLHSPSRADLERFDWAEGLTRLQAQGKIRVPAVAVESMEDARWLMAQGRVGALQLTYNLLRREAEGSVFAEAETSGTGLIGRMPLARGVLTGKFTDPAGVSEGSRALLEGPRLPAMIEAAERIRLLAGDYPGGPTALALHFALRPAAMGVVLAGARNPEQLRANVQAASTAATCVQALDDFVQALDAEPAP